MLLLTFLLLHFYGLCFNSSVNQQVKEYQLLPLLLLLSVYSRLQSAAVNAVKIKEAEVKLYKKPSEFIYPFKNIGFFYKTVLLKQ